MTGKELIIYILENNLENEEIFKDGRLIGFLTIKEAAIKLGVGEATIRAWISLDKINNVKIGETYFIPDNVSPGVDKK